jgi:putative copper resistance protein D
VTAAGLLQPGAALLLNAGFAWLIGSLLVRRWLGGAHPELAARLRHGENGAAVACLTGSVVALWAATALMGDVGLGEAFGMLPMVLLHIAYGQAALAGMVGAILLLLVPHSNWPVRTLLLMLFALARASVSHAGEHGLVSIAVGVEWLHLVLIGVWLGGVGVAGWMVLPTAYFPALSRAATLALAGILASGAYNVWQRMASVDQLLGHPYGMALTVKLALVAGAVALGAYNRFVGFPKAARGQTGPAFLVLRIESVVLLGALAAAAALVSTQPPA